MILERILIVCLVLWVIALIKFDLIVNIFFNGIGGIP